ncbi:hypothetical protein ACWEJS_27080, partial [Rhodococcus triatomae]
MSRPGGDSIGSFRFTARGHALLTANGVGAGRWSSLGPGSFLFRITEPVVDDRGACAGWVDVEQHASQQGRSFTSRAPAWPAPTSSRPGCRGRNRTRCG